MAERVVRFHLYVTATPLEVLVLSVEIERFG